MQRHLAFKFDLRKPTGGQQRGMRRFGGSCRFVYNRALSIQEDNYAKGGKYISYASLCKQLTEWRHSEKTPWLAESPIHTLQQSLLNLDRAYANYFEDLKKLKRGEIRPEDVRQPTHHKKGRSDSFRYPDPKQFRIDQLNGRVFLPKLGWLRYSNSREILGAPRNITVSSVAAKWFISIQTEREVEQSVHPSTSAVGIARFATLSDGEIIEAANALKKHRARLTRYQRMMARRKKFSNNWKKAKAKVQKVHHRIANVRRDFLHKQSTAISKNHATVCVEDLEVRNMSASAKGTVEDPGKNVKQKSGLNRSILDQGWAEFRRMLAYKLEWAGGRLVMVSPQYTSQTCLKCDHVSSGNRKTQARFRCMACGYEEHADLVGSVNILRRGLRFLEGQDTAGRSPRRSTKRARIVRQASGAVMPPATETHRGAPCVR